MIPDTTFWQRNRDDISSKSWNLGLVSPHFLTCMKLNCSIATWKRISIEQICLGDVLVYLQCQGLPSVGKINKSASLQPFFWETSLYNIQVSWRGEGKPVCSHRKYITLERFFLKITIINLELPFTSEFCLSCTILASYSWQKTWNTTWYNVTKHLFFSQPKILRIQRLFATASTCKWY